MSRIVQLADAIVAELKCGAFSQCFEVQRYFAPTIALTEENKTLVLVVPSSISVASRSRGLMQDVIAIDCGVTEKISPDKPKRIEALLTLTEEIMHIFELKRPDVDQLYTWTGTESKLLYDPERLQASYQFFSLFTWSFTYFREGRTHG